MVTKKPKGLGLGLEALLGHFCDPAVALAWLRAAAEQAATLPAAVGVVIYPPVPPFVAKVADVERMQMLLESPSRGMLL